MPPRSWIAIILTIIISTIQPLELMAQATSSSSQTYADGFRPERILEDQDIFGLGNMDRDRIQLFLERRGSLGSQRLRDTDGLDKAVSDIIWRVATTYHINPKYLLALLQKEQSLIEDPDPEPKQFDWATGYAICDNCSKNDLSLQEFKGFASQLEWAAKQHREKYLQQLLTKGQTIAGYSEGQATVIDGEKIIPQNQATAMLYSYTPHIAGNRNLWRIWQRWYGLNFPDGTVVQGQPSKQTYLIRLGQKRVFKSRAVLASLADPNKIALVDDAQLLRYPDGKPLTFPNYSLVEQAGQRFLIDGHKKRLIVSTKVFTKLGFNQDELIQAATGELDSYSDGPDISLTTAYPTGLLAKDAKGQHWYLDGDTRRPIAHPRLLSLYFRSQPARLLSHKRLQAFPLGEPYRLRDGELVQITNQPAIYVIDKGARRAIPDAQTFTELGWQWKNIIALPESLLAPYPVGNPINAHSDNATNQVASASL